MAASASIPKTIYLGTFVHSISLAELEIGEKGAIGVDESGTIRFVEKNVELAQVHEKHGEWKEAEIVELKGNGFFFPGFIDTHTHAPQHPNTGLFGKTTLLSWLETYTFPMESSFSDLHRARTIYTNFVSRTLSHGTTTCAYYATIHVPATNLLASICLSRGQRALIGRVCMNTTLSPEYYRDACTETGIAESKESIEYIRSLDPEGDIIKPIITPRFAPSCTSDYLNTLGALAKESDTHIQTHLSENTSEVSLVSSLFPDSKSYTDVYDTAGLLGPKTILAHCVHLSQEERDTLKSRSAKISHCPASNTALTSGCAPIREFLDQGLVVGLGTDVSGGFSPSILEECRQAIWTSRFRAMQDGDQAKLSTEEVLYLATRGGAAVVGMEERVGGFEVGMEFDAQMICLGGVEEGGEKEGVFKNGPVDVFGWESGEDLVNKWVYGGDDRNCVALWVRGRLVHKTERY